jgi:hypothetical protein
LSTPEQLGQTSGRWFLLLFSLPFLGVGVGMLIFGVMPDLYEWQRMKAWQPVQAQVQAAAVKTIRGDDSTTYQATATYTYDYAGVHHSGSRVAIGSSADNIGDFQQQLGKRLEAAARQGTPVTVWVNPQAPSEAVVDRSLRLEMLFIKLLFGVLFGAVGGGLLVFAIYHWRSVIPITPENADKPWLQRKAWADNRISCTHRTQLWFIWCFAFIWNLISMPLVFFLRDEFREAKPAIWVALVFPIVGIGLLGWAISLTRDWRRHGALYLQLDPFPGAIGGQVGGTIDLPSAYDPDLRFEVILNCIYTYSTGSGKSSRTHHDTVWQAQGMAFAKPYSSGVRLQFLFDVPEDLPASEPETNAYHSWRVDIQSRSRQAPLARQFVIPVYPTKQSSRYLRERSTEHTQMAFSHLEDIERVCDFRQIPGGVELFFPLFRKWWVPLFGVIFGGVFIAVAAGVASHEGPIIVPLVFGTIGVIAAVAGLKTLFNSFRVRLDDSGYASRVWWLGIPVGGRRIPRAQLRQLQLRESDSGNVGGGQVPVYQIRLLLESGASVRVADSVRGEAGARHLAETVSLYTGLPLDKSDTRLKSTRRRRGT